MLYTHQSKHQVRGLTPPLYQYTPSAILQCKSQTNAFVGRASSCVNHPPRTGRPLRSSSESLSPAGHWPPQPRRPSARTQPCDSIRPSPLPPACRLSWRPSQGQACFCPRPTSCIMHPFKVYADHNRSVNVYSWLLMPNPSCNVLFY